jgi:hypothetical protein
MTWYQSLVVAILSGVAASLVTMWLSLKRFYKERWWQRRFDGCAAVIEAIHDMQRLSEIHWRETFLKSRYDEDWRKRASDRGADASRLLRRYADLGELALPLEVAKLLSSYVTETDRSREQSHPDSYEEMIEEDKDREERLLLAIVPAAMKGLGLSRWKLFAND